MNRYEIAFPPGFLLGVTALSFSISRMIVIFWYLIPLHLRLDEGMGKKQTFAVLDINTNNSRTTPGPDICKHMEEIEDYLIVSLILGTRLNHLHRPGKLCRSPGTPCSCSTKLKSQLGKGNLSLPQLWLCQGARHSFSVESVTGLLMFLAVKVSDSSSGQISCVILLGELSAPNLGACCHLNSIARALHVQPDTLYINPGFGLLA